MQQTQVVRDILQAAKGMLPASQQSTQNLRNIEEMARSFVAQGSFSSKVKKEDNGNEEMKQKVNEKVKDEQNFIQKSSIDPSKQIFYEKFEGLCESKQQFSDANVSFKKPRVCIVGMQGSGKSELIEALIGIPFSYCSTGVATTVPIIVETIYKKDVDCRIFFAVSKKKMTPTKFEELTFDQVSKKIEMICESNKFMTKDDEVYIKIEGNKVTPLIYVDLPGFKDTESEVNGGNEEIQKVQKRIEKIWEEYVLNGNSLIVCVERTTQERGSDYSQQWLMDIKGIRNNIIIVGSYFNDKLMECKERSELREYLDDVSDGFKHFYVTFLNTKGLSVKGYNDKLEDRHLEDVRRVVSMGFEDKYLENMGIWRLKEYIRERMIAEYSECFDSVSNGITKQIEELQHKITAMTKEMNTKQDEDAIRRSVQMSISSIGNIIVQLITGECTVNPKEYGETMEEERQSVESEKWPGIGNSISIVGSGMKLYGGAQYERLLREVEAALLTIELPVPTEDEVFLAMGIHAIGGMLNGGERVINVVIKTKAAETLNPIIDIIIKRIVHIFSRLFEISLSLVQKMIPDKTIISNEVVKESMKSFYVEFIKKRLANVEKMLKDDMFSFVSVIDWDMLTSVPMEEDKTETKEGEEISGSQRIKERVEKLMEEKRKNEMKIVQQLRNINGLNSHEEICSICQRVFNVVRECFWRNTRSKLNAYFLQPMIGELKEEFSRETQTVFTSILSTFKSREDQQKEINEIEAKKYELTLMNEQCVELKNLLSSFLSTSSQQFELPNF